MAAERYAKKEHAFITIGKDIKAGKIPSLVLLCGREEYLIRWYADVLIKKYVADACKALDLVVLEGESASAEKIIESLETVSLMSERKVVLLQDFAPAMGADLKCLPAEDLKMLTDYFSEIPEESLLIITAPEQGEKKKGKNKVRSAAEKTGKVYDFQPLNDSQLRSFIGKRFKAAGKQYTPSVLNLIMSESGYGNKSIEYSLYNLENDLKKIIAHSGISPEITSADVSDIIAANPENNVFAMLDAIGRNRKDEAFRLLHNLLNTGGNVFQLLALITGQLELILSIKEMRDEGVPAGTIPKKLGVHEFRVRKAAAVTGLYSMSDLRNALSAAYEVDENIKSGLMEGPLALEFFIAKL